MINRNQYRSLIESVNDTVSGNEISEEKALTWGDPRIGGARNATELARYLNTQTGTSVGTAPASGSRPSGKKMKKPAASSTVAEGWGGPEVYGANNAYELAQRLSDKSGASTSSPSTTGSRPSGKKMKKPAASTTMAESDEIDAIDEILIEGIETYGEEGMAQILAHFAETGEFSQELADLLND
jgi:hypothetical protein